MNQILVVTYSFSGTSLRLAQRLCGQHGWTLGQIRETSPRGGRFATLRCVLDSVFRRRPLIEYVGPSPRQFDAVVVVSPIWVEQLAGPMRSFLAQYARQIHGLAVISVMAARGAPNAVAEIGRITRRSPVLTTAFTTREAEDGSCARRLESFGTALLAATGRAPAIRPAEWSPRAA